MADELRGGGEQTGGSARRRAPDLDSVRDVYDRMGAGYDRWTKWLDRSVSNRLRDELLSTARGRVLEVAIGSGKNLRFYPRDISLVGLDLSTEMLRVATDRAERLGRSIETLSGDASELPFADGSFDTVVCTLGGCTFPDPAAVFIEMRRVCRADGRALFLEHVRPRSRIGRWVIERVKPFSCRLLGCDPSRETIRTVAASGWTITERQDALQGILVAARADPS